MTVVRAYVAVTDNDWYRFLAALPGVTEVNFWQPTSDREFRALARDEPFFFKTHHPHNKVVGGGLFKSWARMPVSEAWELFGEANGVESIEQMRARIGRYRRTPIDSSEDPLIGCIIVQDVRFFPQGAIAEPPPQFAANIVQGKGYDLADPSVAPYFRVLLQQLPGAAVVPDSLGPAEPASQASDKPGFPEDESETIEPARLIVPAITDDAIEDHPDQLGIDADARALAALVASRQLEPPLAIGLYGEWGSGKTFFMKRVQSYIRKLGTSDVEVFYSAVAPVWFSAWQYAEGNLWASLLHHIFSSLYPNKPQPQAVLDKVMAKVESAQQVTLAVAEQVDTATTRRDSAVEAIAAAEKRHRKALEDSGKLRTKDLWEAITLTADDQDLKEQVVSAADDLGLIVASDSAQDMMRATQHVVGLASRVRVLATSGPWYRSPLAFAFYAAVIVGSFGLLIGAAVHAAHAWTGTAITAIGQLAAVGSAAAAWVIRQGSLARRFIAPAEALRQRLEDRLAKQQEKNERELVALEQDAETAKAELAVALERGAIAAQQLAAAEQERTELTGTRLLRRYLAERASSGDYEHYMGVVALAHRDLVNLEDYLRAAIDDKEGREGLDRIVLYIDDLDRCDPDVVADVLDAVHLLLALPLFVVIVGVDPRWLKRSLHERHPELLSPTRSGIPSTSAADYLEKIFQLTYSLPHMSSDRCADLLVAAAHETQRPPIRATDPTPPETEAGIEDISLGNDDRGCRYVF